MSTHLTQSEKSAMSNSEVFEAAFTCKEAGKILGVSRPTLMGLINSGRLPAFRIGTHWRIKPSDLRSFIDGKSEKE